MFLMILFCPGVATSPGAYGRNWDAFSRHLGYILVILVSKRMAPTLTGDGMGMEVGRLCTSAQQLFTCPGQVFVACLHEVC